MRPRRSASPTPRERSRDDAREGLRPDAVLCNRCVRYTRRSCMLGNESQGAAAPRSSHMGAAARHECELAAAVSPYARPERFEKSRGHVTARACAGAGPHACTSEASAQERPNLDPETKHCESHSTNGTPNEELCVKGRVASTVHTRTARAPVRGEDGELHRQGEHALETRRGEERDR